MKQFLTILFTRIDLAGIQSTVIKMWKCKANITIKKVDYQCISLQGHHINYRLELRGSCIPLV